MYAKTFFLVVAFGLMLSALSAQSPDPIIIAAATPAAEVKATVAPNDTASEQTALKLLQEMKAANEETLKKQEAALLQLEELEKAAEQIKIYTKRG